MYIDLIYKRIMKKLDDTLIAFVVYAQQFEFYVLQFN